jgi:hypothetical protein
VRFLFHRQSYGRGTGVGRARGRGVGLVAGVGVAVSDGVAVAVELGVNVAVAVGVGDGGLPSKKPKIWKTWSGHT